jgi:hypothetical protein
MLFCHQQQNPLIVHEEKTRYGLALLLFNNFGIRPYELNGVHSPVTVKA